MANVEIAEPRTDAYLRPGRRAKILTVLPLVAGLSLAACTGGQTPAPPVTAASTTLESSAPQTTAQKNTTRATPMTIQSTSVGEGPTSCVPYFDTVKFPDHEYEVCVAYVTNASKIALQGFYKFGNSKVGYLANPARHHFETRYYERPRKTIENEVDGWAKESSATGNKVEAAVGVISVESSLKDDRALLRTMESWQVKSGDGDVLYDEPLHEKDVTMCRGKLPGHILHEWMVVAYTPEPEFDCIAFDEANMIMP